MFMTLFWHLLIFKYDRLLKLGSDLGLDLFLISDRSCPDRKGKKVSTRVRKRSGIAS